MDLRLRSWLEGGIKPGAALQRSHANFDLRGMVRDRIWPPGESRTITEGRYVAMWGFAPHSAEDQGFVWADPVTGVSAFAVNDFRAPDAEHDCFALGSRTLGASDLPSAFLTAFDQWRSQAPDRKHDCAYFIDGRTSPVKITEMALPHAGRPAQR